MKKKLNTGIICFLCAVFFILFFGGGIFKNDLSPPLQITPNQIKAAVTGGNSRSGLSVTLTKSQKALAGAPQLSSNLQGYLFEIRPRIANPPMTPTVGQRQSIKFYFLIDESYPNQDIKSLRALSLSGAPENPQATVLDADGDNQGDRENQADLEAKTGDFRYLKGGKSKESSTLVGEIHNIWDLGRFLAKSTIRYYQDLNPHESYFYGVDYKGVLFCLMVDEIRASNFYSVRRNALEFYFSHAENLRFDLFYPSGLSDSSFNLDGTFRTNPALGFLAENYSGLNRGGAVSEDTIDSGFTGYSNLEADGIIREQTRFNIYQLGNSYKYSRIRAEIAQYLALPLTHKADGAQPNLGLTNLDFDDFKLNGFLKENILNNENFDDLEELEQLANELTALKNVGLVSKFRDKVVSFGNSASEINPARGGIKNYLNLNGKPVNHGNIFALLANGGNDDFFSSENAGITSFTANAYLTDLNQIGMFVHGRNKLRGKKTARESEAFDLIGIVNVYYAAVQKYGNTDSYFRNLRNQFGEIRAIEENKFPELGPKINSPGNIFSLLLFDGKGRLSSIQFEQLFSNITLSLLDSFVNGAHHLDLNRIIVNYRDLILRDGNQIENSARQNKIAAYLALSSPLAGYPEVLNFPLILENENQFRLTNFALNGRLTRVSLLFASFIDLVHIQKFLETLTFPSNFKILVLRATLFQFGNNNPVKKEIIGRYLDLSPMPSENEEIDFTFPSNLNSFGLNNFDFDTGALRESDFTQFSIEQILTFQDGFLQFETLIPEYTDSILRLGKNNLISLGNDDESKTNVLKNYGILKVLNPVLSGETSSEASMQFGFEFPPGFDLNVFSGSGEIHNGPTTIDTFAKMEAIENGIRNFQPSLYVPTILKTLREKLLSHGNDDLSGNHRSYIAKAKKNDDFSPSSLPGGLTLEDFLETGELNDDSLTDLSFEDYTKIFHGKNHLIHLSNRISLGIILAIVFGSLFFLLVLSSGIFYGYRSRKK